MMTRGVEEYKEHKKTTDAKKALENYVDGIQYAVAAKLSAGEKKHVEDEIEGAIS